MDWNKVDPTKPLFVAFLNVTREFHVNRVFFIKDGIMFWSPISISDGNPRSPYFYRVCSAQGFVTWNELIETLSAPEKGTMLLESTSLSVENAIFVDE